MKRHDLMYGLLLLAFSLCLAIMPLLAICQHNNKYDEAEKIVEYIPEGICYEDAREKDWEIFTEALIWVESKGYSNVVGKKDDVGVLQITPILLQDCNRIVGYEKYYLNDRYDRDKSIEMFNLIQDHYNPQHDFHWALKLWNSGAPLSYHRKVMDKFNEIKNN